MGKVFNVYVYQEITLKKLNVFFCTIACVMHSHLVSYVGHKFEHPYFAPTGLEKRLELIYRGKYAEKEALEKSYLLYKNISQCFDGKEDSCVNALGELNRIGNCKDDEGIRRLNISKEELVALTLTLVVYPENLPTQEDFEALANLSASFETEE